jgi:uroporphyrinogen-III synthase
MILITRPKTESKNLQKQLNEFGIQSFVEPLTSFKFLDRTIKYNKDAIYICASQRTIEAIIQSKSKSLLSANFIVVGESVKALMYKKKFSSILYTADESKQLIKWMCKKNNKMQHYIYLGGSIVNDDFINNLKLHKIQYKRKIIYQTLKKKDFSFKFLQNLRQKKIMSVIFFSKTNAKQYFELLKKNKMHSYSKDQMFFCLSHRIAEFLKKQNISTYLIQIPRDPKLTSMINLLKLKKFLINQ